MDSILHYNSEGEWKKALKLTEEFNQRFKDTLDEAWIKVNLVRHECQVHLHLFKEIGDSNKKLEANFNIASPAFKTYYLFIAALDELYNRDTKVARKKLDELEHDPPDKNCEAYGSLLATQAFLQSWDSNYYYGMDKAQTVYELGLAHQDTLLVFRSFNQYFLNVAQARDFSDFERWIKRLKQFSYRKGLIPEIIDILLNVSAAYTEKGNPEIAAKTALEVIALADRYESFYIENNWKNPKLKTYVNLAYVAIQSKDLIKAKKYQRLAQKENPRKKYELNSLKKLQANILFLEKKYKASYDLFAHVDSISVPLGSKGKSPRNKVSMAKCLVKMQKYDEALVILENSNSFFSEKNKTLNALIQEPIAFDIAYALNQNSKALSIANSFASRAKEYGDPMDKKQAQKMLYSIYEKMGNYDLSLKHKLAYKEIKNRIFANNNSDFIIQLESQHQLNEREKKLNQLNILEQKNQQKLSIKKLSMIILSIGIFIALIFGIIILLLISKNKSLQEQRSKLENEKFDSLLKEKEVMILNAMLDGQEKERQRMSRDLHDGLGGLLSRVKMSFHHKQDLNTSILQAQYARNELLIDRSIQEVRNLSHKLFPAAIQGIGLFEAIEDLIIFFQRENSIDINFQKFEWTAKLSPKVNIFIYRTVEQLLLLSKTSKAKNIFIQSSQQADSVELSFEDDAPIALYHPDPKFQSQIRLLSNRAIYFHGYFEIQQIPSEGNSALLSLPKN